MADPGGEVSVTENDSDIWHFVIPERRVLPSTSVRRTLRSGFYGFVEKLRPTYYLPAAEPFRPRDDLAPLSRRQLERIVPQPEWQLAGDCLAAELSDWRDDWGNVQSAALVVAPPFSGLPETLAGIGQAQGWQLIEPPTPAQILVGDDRWLNQFDGETPWVLPELAHCYLRHAHGLRLARHFLSRVWDGEFGPGVIGCDSWAWEYWNHVMPNLLPSRLMPQALDHQHLGRWLQHLADPDDRHPVRFRQADSGDWVLTARQEGDIPKGRKHSGFLRDLAAYSRGLPGVAWALWRLALRAEPENEVAATEEAEGASVASANPQGNDTRTIWVTAWDMVKPPSVPQLMSPQASLILHALLLHAGLDAEMLAKVCNMELDAVLQGLHLLRRAQLIEKGPRGWMLTAVGYPNVRRHLGGQGLPVDSC